MPNPFEEYDDLDALAVRLPAADGGERRVAVIGPGHAGDPAAIALLDAVISYPDAGVRRQVALSLGEYDGIEAAAGLARAVVDAETSVATAAADSMAELKDPAAADAIFPLVSHASGFVRMAAFRALKELRRSDSLKPALEALRDPDPSVRVQAVGVVGFHKR